MSESPFGGWYLEMENPRWYGQPLPSPRRPSRDGARERASRGRPRGSPGSRWLVQASPRNKSQPLNCRTATFLKIIHDSTWHIPEFSMPCGGALAKDHVWLAGLPLFCRVAKAGDRELLVQNWTRHLPPNLSLQFTLSGKWALSPPHSCSAQKSMSHPWHLPLPPTSTLITWSCQPCFQNVCVCQSLATSPALV